jgi:hypothetical protein
MDQGNDVEGALAAYREAVTRLQSVMERVSSDEGKRKKGGKSDEEGRTLRGIVSLNGGGADPARCICSENTAAVEL